MKRSPIRRLLISIKNRVLEKLMLRNAGILPSVSFHLYSLQNNSKEKTDARKQNRKEVRRALILTGADIVEYT